LFCADNDPDARGPNRLVHVIGGGDYGYKSMFGGGGNHPFQSWNGELPGTLPLAAGLGEAPCGVIDASLAALPGQYRDSLLVTVWGEHNMTRAKLRRSGVSVKAETEILIEGGQDFRPVGIAADGEGVIYFADWVRRDYPNHGKGRVWRLAAKKGVETVKPRRAFDVPVADEGATRLTELDLSRDDAVLEAALSSIDPFERSAAVTALARPEFWEKARRAVAHAKADVRLGALLALRKTRCEDAGPIARRLLADADPVVRRMALVWAGERGMESLRDDIRKAIEAPGVSAGLFETYLAASECLTPEFVSALRSGKETKANKLPRRLDPGVVESIVRDESAAGALRALALTRLMRPEAQENFEALKKLVASAEPRLRLEAVRTLASTRHKEAAGVLLGVVSGLGAPGDVRAEAVLALLQHGEFAEKILPLLGDGDGAVRVEAARVLRAHVSEPPVRAALAERLKVVEASGGDARLAEQLRFAVQSSTKERPESVEAWQSALSDGGDPASGARVFQSANVGCARCHTVNNRGGRIGPDLSNVGQSLARAKIVRAIVRPSDEYSIDWQAWFIKTRDGDTHLGLQLDLKDEGAIELFTLDGKTAHFKGKDVAGYGALKQSIMPEGLEAGMSVEDFRDLVAYLESLR
jgi:putative heme-binding domain-containing protein